MRDREVKDGLGAPVVAKRVADQVHELAPTPHFYYTATAVARFEGARCVISIDQPLQHETVRVGSRTYPLAADYTAPLAMMLVEMNPKELGLPRLLRPAEFADTTRIARLAALRSEQDRGASGAWLELLARHLVPDDQPPAQGQGRSGRTISSGSSVIPAAIPIRIPPPSSGGSWTRRRNSIRCAGRWSSSATAWAVASATCSSPTASGGSGTGCSPCPRKKWRFRRITNTSSPSRRFSHRRPEIGRVIFISTPHRGSELADDWVGRLVHPAGETARHPGEPGHGGGPLRKKRNPVPNTSTAFLTASTRSLRTTSSSKP